MDELALKLADGTTIIVPRSLDCLTTYVLLEQDSWFEKEIAVLNWFAPGMIAIDIGANFGVYSLSIARRVAPDGQVFAYEPASEPRSYLTKSRETQRLHNLHILPFAVSDRPREGRLALSFSSEFNRLGEENEAGETIAITSLDEEDRIRAWPRVDFIKIDAEGEEVRIVDGGKAFFARHSPLVMFEFKAGDQVDLAIPEAFRAIGYRVFRLLNGRDVLVPVEAGEILDRFELNLFAAKPDRVAMLAKQGRLIDRVELWAPDEAARRGALDLLRAQVCARAFEPLFARYLDTVYVNALAGYAAWRAAERPLPVRYGALQFAFSKLSELCAKAATGPRLSTLARVAWEAGHTSIAIDAISAIAQRFEQVQPQLSEPFWPVAPRYDDIAPGTRVLDWFSSSLLEQFERWAEYSAVFSGRSIRIDRILKLPYATAEMERRNVLPRLKAGERLAVPARLLHPAPDHLNAEVWRAGLVPNTLAPGQASSE